MSLALSDAGPFVGGDTGRTVVTIAGFFGADALAITNLAMEDLWPSRWRR